MNNKVFSLLTQDAFLANEGLFPMYKNMYLILMLLTIASRADTVYPNDQIETDQNGVCHRP